MKSVVVDKIASVTQACGLGHELRISTDIPCEEGVVLVVEILNNKSTYNTLELTSGRMAKLARGDIIVGALGHRKALFGYSGHLPESVQPGDVIQLLNIGGVLGICDSATPDKGKPFECRVLGVVLQFPYLGERIGVPARVGFKPLDFNAPLNTRNIPVVALAGTCMEAGKTAAACAIVSRMRHRGLVVDAFKATGVSLRRDILAMEDAGARRSMIFTDLGVVTTTPKTGPALTRSMLTEMAAGKPDVIVFELGDGILGTYGVEAILKCDDIRSAITGLVLSANDPVAAWGGVKLLREKFHIEPCVVTGPSTDNQVGVQIIHEQMNVAAFNAITDGAALGDQVIASVGLDKAVPAQAVARVSTSVPTFVLGGTGYVAGELLRLIAGHPNLKLAAILSDSQPGELVAKAFPHLQSAYPELRFASHEEIAAAISREKASALFSAAPHGVSAGLVDGLLKRAQEAGGRVRAVDISADFRHPSAAAYEKIYKHAHGAPDRIKRIHLRCARASQGGAHTAYRPSGLLRDRHPARERAAPRARHRGAAALRRGRDRQHWFRSQADGRHAPSAETQRFLHLQRARAPPHAGNRGVRSGGDRDRGGVRLRATFRAVRARHSCHGAGAAQERV